MKYAVNVLHTRAIDPGPDFERFALHANKVSTMRTHASECGKIDAREKGNGKNKGEKKEEE